MSLFQGLFSRSMTSSQLYDFSKGYDFSDLFGTGGGKRTNSGAFVTKRSAEQLSAVYSCIDLVSTAQAMLPVEVYTPIDVMGRAPVEASLRPQWIKNPTPEHTWPQWVEELVTSMMTDGNFYAQVIQGAAGEPVALWPLDPGRVTPRWGWEYGGEIPAEYARNTFYDVQLDNGQFFRGVPRYRFELADRQPPMTIFHIKGRGPAGRAAGLSPIQECAEAIGLGMVAEEYGARFFSNGATAGGLISFPDKYREGGDKDARRMIAMWNEDHQGAASSHKIGALWGGATYTSVAIPPEQAQFLQLRRFQVEEIARIYRVPPHMIAANERQSTTGTSIEHQQVGFATHTVGPNLVRLEMAVEKFLLPPEMQFRTDTVQLLRADTKTRYEAYALGLQNGFLNINEIRHLEDRTPILDGNDHYLPANNLVPLDLIDTAILARGTGRPPERGQDDAA